MQYCRNLFLLRTGLDQALQLAVFFLCQGRLAGYIR